MTSYTVRGERVTLDREGVARSLAHELREVERLSAGRYNRDELADTPAERWAYLLWSRSEVARFAAILQCIDDSVAQLPKTLYPGAPL